MYVITGATGNTGKPVAMALLKAGKKVRIICRDAAKAKELVDLGAELRVGNLLDVKFVTSAFSGATAAYLMLPPNMLAEDFTAYQKQLVDSMAQALKNNGVQHEITLSSIGAHLERNSGLVLGLHYAEQTFNAIPGLNTLHLRPAYFMENTLGMAGMAKHTGKTGTAVKGNLSFPIIASRDISAYALKRLLALDFNGHNVQYLLGNRDVTYKEIARLYAKAIGKPELSYEEISYPVMKNTIVSQWGATEKWADLFVEFVRRLNEGRIMSDAERNAENTTPTTIEEFVPVFRQLYDSV